MNVFTVIFPHLTLLLSRVLFPLSLFHFKSRFHFTSLYPKHVCLLMMMCSIGMMIFKLMQFNYMGFFSKLRYLLYHYLRDSLDGHQWAPTLSSKSFSRTFYCNYNLCCLKTFTPSPLMGGLMGNFQLFAWLQTSAGV